MFLTRPDQSDATNRQISPNSVDWWPQIALRTPGTYFSDVDLIMGSCEAVLYHLREKEKGLRSIEAAH